MKALIFTPLGRTTIETDGEHSDFYEREHLLHQAIQKEFDTWEDHQASTDQIAAYQATHDTDPQANAIGAIEDAITYLVHEINTDRINVYTPSHWQRFDFASCFEY